ncbi:DUF4157 domain-containing protein [uncultured Shewanella sp.]|uniref:eCIS core domain-containing protein n=1 Tax=uncultured Shewanella sp. TaxID=173975 RepID=UPI00260B1C95|nr:DUF4157 domain-containing protein [uncultured Shewanella sp.]
MYLQKEQQEDMVTSQSKEKVDYIQMRSYSRAGRYVPGQSGYQAPTVNRTGLPDHVKAGVEHLSGVSLDHVKVNYNSAKPAQLNAHAYAQGSEIHMAPGQNKHVAHEAWHLTQQAQGRVAPTTQFAGHAINDSQALEHEADVMGAKAESIGRSLV